MKCPKCDYLGFETGDRCKNCGYDFSLMSEPDILLRHDDPLTDASASSWLDHFDRDPATTPAPAPDSFAEPVEELPPALELAPAATASVTPEPESLPRPEAAPPVPFRAPRPRVIELSLPLFNPDDDTPLVKLPAAPRAPLAVRRTPDTPRLRAVPRPARRGAAERAVEAEPVLAFSAEEAPVAPVRRPDLSQAETSQPGRRLAAAAIDHAMLFAIDGIVIYFTLRLVSLDVGDWRALPPVPLVIFLGLVKAAYFCVFTLVGGQTIGKMAARIQVIADDNRPIDPARAVRRTLAGALSFVTMGLGFLPALMASDRRAVHDRFARTRVVALS